MSTKHYCDKCKKEMRTSEKIYFVEVANESNGGRNIYELCKSCQSKLLKWLKDD